MQVIKLWDLDKPDRIKTGPTLERSIRVQQTKEAFPVSALAVLENLSQIAVGLANGVVVLINGDLMRERTTAQKIVHQNDEPITGIIVVGIGQALDVRLRRRQANSLKTLQVWDSRNSRKAPCCLSPQPQRFFCTIRLPSTPR